jgi:peptidoglycan hydrolase CwlO-like protein
MKRRTDGYTEPETSDLAPETPPESSKSKKIKSQKSVYIYISTLFFVVMLFIFLSYMVQQRNDTALSALHEKNVTAQEHIENLQSANLQLESENDALMTESETNKQKIAALESKLEALKSEVDILRNIQEALLRAQAQAEN